jgi:hypothetical protein
MGRITLSLGFILSLLPPVLLWVIYGIFPPVKSLLNGIFSISILMLPVSIVEILTFVPMLGAGALYMSYLTGNLSNLKIPSAAIALESVNVKPATKEGDIIANIAIAGSILASEAVLISGVILIAPLSGYLQNPVIRPAFDQILPALFGSIGAYYILKDWRLAVAPIAVAVSLSFIRGLPTAITIPICVGVSVLSARFMYKKNWLKSNEDMNIND